MKFPFGEIVTIIRRSAMEPDKYGDYPTATTTRIDIPGCGLAQKSSSEPTVRGRQGSNVMLSLYAPEGTDIRYDDKIEIHGGGTFAGAPVTPATAAIYFVDGQPATWKNPLTGTSFGVEVSLKSEAI